MVGAESVWIISFLSLFSVSFTLPLLVYCVCTIGCNFSHNCSKCFGLEDEQYTINITTPRTVGDVRLEFVHETYPMRSYDQRVTRLQPNCPVLELISVPHSDLPPSYEDVTIEQNNQ